jgi:putative transposase
VLSLDQVIEWRGKPQAIRSDNGPEFISAKLAEWAEKRGIRLGFIQPDNPQQNAYVERYNRTVRYDWLGHYFFESIAEVLDYGPELDLDIQSQTPEYGPGGITPKQTLALVA